MQDSIQAIQKFVEKFELEEEITSSDIDSLIEDGLNPFLDHYIELRDASEQLLSDNTIFLEMAAKDKKTKIKNMKFIKNLKRLSEILHSKEEMQ